MLADRLRWERRHTSEQFDPPLAPGLKQQARHTAQDGRRDHLGIEHQPHGVSDQLAFFARRSARMAAISWATSSGDIAAG